MKDNHVPAQNKQQLGFGLGLRTEHYETLSQSKFNIDWLEIITENYLVPGGKPLYYLDKIREIYPIVMHGVSMTIGSSDPLNWDYLTQVKALANRVKPYWISDHLCWTGVQGKNTHDLLPLPYTTEAINHIVSRIKQVQDFLETRILLENVSSYITYKQSTLTEWEFIKTIAEESDCFILLDINNVYISSINHEFDPLAFINAIPSERIYQIHLAGHTNMGDYIIDTHDHEIIENVWDLYFHTIQKHGLISTMIERDDNIPDLPQLIEELDHARQLATMTMETTI